MIEPKSRRLRVGSLFCGAGGLDLGFRQAGFALAWALDNDPDSCATYRTNLGEHVRCVDVRTVRFEDLGDVEVIIGGFPCQGFSIANQHRAITDERNTLYLEFVRAVRTLKPRAFVAENVKGILSLGRGTVIKQIAADFASLGYKIDYRLLDAAEFGIPQHRRRVFIVGTKSGESGSLQWPLPICPNTRPFRTVGEALCQIPEPCATSTIPNHVGSRYKVTSRNFTGHRATDPNKPSPTILARGNGGGGVCAINHPNNHRRMTVREQALLQDFPLDYSFSGTMSSAYRQVGNAVPPGLAQHVAYMVRSTLSRKGPEQ
jgi:DNA (cytosine-5)-methyltransferase 1